VFVQYRGDSHDDKVAKLGQMQAKSLQTDFKFTNVVPVDSRDDVLNTLKGNRSTVQMLITYTHASSGTVVHDDGHGQILVSEDPAGPKLLFTTHEALPARDLNEVSRAVAGRIVLDNAPLVILNGCETGTAGFYATTNLDFPGTFLAMGARGVLATEAPVWDLFAYNFALSLMRKATAGDPIPVALFKTRLEFLSQSHPR
jgi:hypothetical protein